MIAPIAAITDEIVLMTRHFLSFMKLFPFDLEVLLDLVELF